MSNHKIIKVRDLNKEEEKPEFLKQDTIVFGAPGAGKTTFLKVISEIYKNDTERFENAQKARLKNGFAPLPANHCVFSNISDKSDYYGGGNKESYAFDPYKFMRPNKEYRFEQIVAWGVYTISEAQKYYDSYLWKDIPQHVYYVIQNRRQIRLRLIFDCQRPRDIASKIREIFKLFIRPVSLEVKLSEITGEVLETIIHYLEFTDINATEKFIEEYGEDEELMLSHPDLKTYTAPYDFRKIFNSYENENIIYEDPEKQDRESTILPRGQIVTFKEIAEKYPNYFATYWEKIEKEKEEKKRA